MEYILFLFEKFTLQWNESGMLDLIGLILSTVVPIIIMIVTLRSERKMLNKMLLTGSGNIRNL